MANKKSAAPSEPPGAVEDFDEYEDDSPEVQLLKLINSDFGLETGEKFDLNSKVQSERIQARRQRIKMYQRRKKFGPPEPAPTQVS